MIKADLNFKKTLEDLFLHGAWDLNPRAKWSDGTPAQSLFVTQKFETYDINLGEFPLINARRIPWKSAIKEILWIYQDQSNDLGLLRDKHNIHWWNEWESVQLPGTIGNRYGYTVKKNNLIVDLIEGIKTNPYGRRHIMSLWDLQHLNSSDGLAPCAYETLWAVRGQYLDCTLIQRSSDFLTANSINKIQYVALQMMIAQECGLRPGKFSHLVNNVHIYDRHVEIARSIYNNIEDWRPQAKLILAPKNFWEVGIDDFSLSDYEPSSENFGIEVAI